MPKTLLHPRPSTDTYELPSRWSAANGIVQGFEHELEFADMLRAHAVNPLDRTSLQYAHGLSLYVQDYVEKFKDDATADKKQLAQVQILANTPYFIHIQKEMVYFDYELDKRHRLSDEDWSYFQGFKPYLVWFNQLLSEYAYESSNETLSEVDAALIAQVQHLFPNDLAFIEKEINQVVRGARTEAVARELLDRTPIDFSPGTIEDDLRGGDFIVVRGGHRIKVDIKSSRSSIAEVRGGYEEMERRNITYAISKNRHDKNKEQHVIVLYPGFNDDDLGDSLSLHLPDDVIQQHANYVTDQLNLAFQELNV